MSITIIKRFKSLFLLAVIFSVIITGLSFSEASAATNSVDDLKGFRLVPACTGPGGECVWADVVKLFDNLLRFIVIVSIPLSALLFMYAGFLYLTARGNPGQISKASNIFISVAIGFAIVMGSFLFVKYLLGNLASTSGYEPLLE